MRARSGRGRRVARTATRAPAALAALLATVLAPIVVDAQLYRWKDASGVVHYTGDLLSIPPAFRDGAQDVGSPQARPPEPAPSMGSTVIPFAAGAPILAAAAVNGTPLTLMIDTGAERTLISPRALERTGLTLEAGRPVRILGVTGAAGAREVVVPRLDLAGTQVGPVAVIVHEGSFGGADGLLGRDVLDGFTLTVDAAAGQATLLPRQ